MIETSTKIDNHVTTELTKNIKILSFSFLLIGCVGLILYIVLSTILPEDVIWVNFFIVFAVPFAIGLVLVFSIKNSKKLNEKNNLENIYIFNEDHFIINTLKNNEKIATVKVYYNELTKKTESKSFLFLFINKISAFPVKKENLSSENLIQLKALLGFKLNMDELNTLK